MTSAGPSEIGITVLGAMVLIAGIKHSRMASDDLKQQVDLQQSLHLPRAVHQLYT